MNKGQLGIFPFTTPKYFLYARYMVKKRHIRTTYRKHKRVDFRIRPVHFFFGVVFFVALLANPSPADITPQTIYQKLAHTLFPQESEYLSDSYVKDILSQTGEYQKTDLASVWDNEEVGNLYGSPASSFLANVLPAYTDLHIQAAVDDSKWIEIDLSDQKIMAWEDGAKAMEFLISSGKPWTPTPTGEWRIWIKLRHANMKGGSKERGDYYFLPNVPYVMYFYKGYGIHGAYWHMNFGHPMSHGCVNMKPDEAGQLFAWATPDMQGKPVIKSSDKNPGTRVVIHE